MVALRSVRFAEAPAIGVAVVINGQRYDLISTEPYQRRDGTATRLSVWMGECATCCRPFVARAPLLGLPEARRCEEHKQLGKTASAEGAGK